MLASSSRLLRRSLPLLIMRASTSTSSAMTSREYCYGLPSHLMLTVAQGSVLEFAAEKGAIVNAANEGCLDGGGVDGAITAAGGENLANDRMALNQIAPGIRCKTGSAVITGPGDYGSLKVPYVVHAVGPNYMMFDEENDVETPNQLLRSAYQASLDRAAENSVEKIAFSLLSAGIFRGDQSLDSILGIGVQAIHDWCQGQSPGTCSLKEVYMYAFNERESKTLRSVCDKILIPGADDKS